MNSTLSHVCALRGRMQAAESSGEMDPAAARRYAVENFQSVMAIERNVLRSSRLVDNVFEAARLLGQQLLLDYSLKVNLMEVLIDLSDELRVFYPDRVPEIELEPELPNLKAERARLEQVMSCLLNNASRYTPREGRVGIRARVHMFSRETLGTAEELPVEEWLPEGRYVHVEVWDHGPGIPIEERKRVFQPFYRLKRDSGGVKGMGLGLFICHGLVASHGGAIWITDTVGAAHGTTVHVLWPAESRDTVADHGR